jgi:hypothetical protein
MLLDDLEPPTAYSVTFEGQGGAAGFAKGSARVTLAPQDGDRATLMSYQVQAQVGGKLAQIGSRLVDAAARKVADDFFTAFTEKIASTQPSAAAAVGSDETQAARRRRWAVIALAALGALVAVIWLFATRSA